jgi:Domain of unknown function (DU1801)
LWPRAAYAPAIPNPILAEVGRTQWHCQRVSSTLTRTAAVSIASPEIPLCFAIKYFPLGSSTGWNPVNMTDGKPATAAAAEKQLQEFIGKFDKKSQAVIRAARAALRRRMPSANELVYDNYNFFVIGYCSTERPTDCVVSIAAGASGVGLSFYYGATLPDPHNVLLGSGVQNRFIRLPSADVLSRPEVEALIAAALLQAEPPMPASGKGKLIIRSISKKQRPRRKPCS